MTSIWINSEHMVLRKWGATVSDTTSIVRIEVEVRDENELAYLLRQCREAKEEAQRAARQAAAAERAARKEASTAARKAGKALTHAPLLALPYYGSEP